MSRHLVRVSVGAFILSSPSTLLAGMPSIGLSDIAQLRLQAVSFFLMGLLVSAAVIQGLWNWLARDLSALPQLTYKKACAVVVLWGILFVIVLTMISGARELMTPGAWEKQGLTYQLASRSAESTSTLDSDPLAVRRDRIAQLGERLLRYARENAGRFPEESVAISSEFWRVPEGAGFTYVYLPQAKLGEANRVIAYEPALFTETHVVLANGQVAVLSRDELDKLIENGAGAQ